MPTPDLPASPLDSHLILNGLGRVSARYYAATRQECAEVFAVSDYVALGLRLMGQTSASCAQEAALLEAYLALHAACKYTGLEVNIQAPPDVLEGQLPPHMVCDMARCLIEWLRPEAGQAWALHAQLDTERITLQVCSTRPAPLPQAALQSAIALLSAGLERRGWQAGLCGDAPALPDTQARIVARLRNR